MNLIRTFEQLKNHNLYNCKQFWYYVILLNPKDISPAGKAVLDNLNIFHLDSGEECQFFIPGFLNTGNGIITRILSFFQEEYKIINIPSLGNIQFSDAYFVEFYKELETRNNIGWRYSGECELLLFNISMGDKIKLNNFASYNLDDIVRNKRNVSEFIRLTINIGKDTISQTEAKCILDEKFYEMVVPDFTEWPIEFYDRGWQLLCQKGFRDNSYIFLSYSSQDFKIVSEVRRRLCSAGVSCWMAPFDIPNGTNYAWVIEHAIKHAQKFVLMLSKSAVNSVWVGKELKRAISRFQLNSPDKICIVWLEGRFDIEDTPLALPLEDIQISIDLDKNPNNYYLLVSAEKQQEIRINEKIKKHREEIKRYLLPNQTVGNLRAILSRIRAIYAMNSKEPKENLPLLELCDKLNAELDLIEKLDDIRSKEYMVHYIQAIDYLIDIKQHIEY